jgi:O-antigen ligase
VLTQPSALSNFLRCHGAALLVLSVLVLLPIGIAAAATPLMLAAILGLAFAWRDRRKLRANDGLRLAVLLFACYWLAALISAPDSVSQSKSWSTVGGLLRFLPFAAFACLTLRDARAWSGLVHAAGAVIAFWLFDAWIQALTGFSLGGPSDKDHLTGIFGSTGFKFGPVLAVLSPFVLLAGRQRFGRPGLIASFILALVPILLAGERSAWLIYALVTLIFVWRETRTPLRFVGWGSAAATLGAAATLVALQVSPAFDLRVERTLRALQGTEAAVDYASSGRSMQIWPTALRMIGAHPINGVGVRAFRFAYVNYAAPGDKFVNSDSEEGALHAHQIVLEVLSETGAIGFALWIFGAYAAVRAWQRASASARARAFAPGLALAVMTFPLNTHLAFYSAWWGLLFWWLLALYCAALYADDTQVRDDA